MCLFCEKIDEFEHFVKIHKEKQDFGARASITNEVLLYFDDEYDGLSAELNFSCCVGDDIDNMIADIYIPINYCPWCGRKFKNPAEVEE